MVDAVFSVFVKTDFISSLTVIKNVIFILTFICKSRIFKQ